VLRFYQPLLCSPLPQRVGGRLFAPRDALVGWYLEIKLDVPEQVDKEIVAWLKKAYELAG
jgi:hypothetical protein